MTKHIKRIVPFSNGRRLRWTRSINTQIKLCNTKHSGDIVTPIKQAIDKAIAPKLQRIDEYWERQIFNQFYRFRFFLDVAYNRPSTMIIHAIWRSMQRWKTDKQREAHCQMSVLLINNRFSKILFNPRSILLYIIVLFKFGL